MRLIKLSVVALAAIAIGACHTTKKTVAIGDPSPTAPPPAPVVTKAPNGVYSPGNDELTAIQAKYPGTTLATLTEGYTLYTGACVNCHNAKSIYNRSEERWANIMDDMAPKARLTDAQKDAVYKYVLAIKATQAK